MSLIAPIVQSLLVLSLSVLPALAPSQGAVRAVALHPVAIAAILNAVVAVDGRLVATTSDGALLLAGRRDRIIRALLPLGVLAWPVRRVGCGEV